MANPKKLITDDISVSAAEEKLDIVFPAELRDLLKQRNGFEKGYFRFFCVLDKEDPQHTFDDIVRENTNPVAGWKQYLPEGFVAIADDGGNGCLALSTNKDGKIYYWDHGLGEMSEYAENGKDLLTKLDKEQS